MWLAGRTTSHSLPEIGRAFGDRDHTTVMHAIRAVERRRQKDPHLATELDQIVAGLTPDEAAERRARERTEHQIVADLVEQMAGLAKAVTLLTIKVTDLITRQRDGAA